MNNFKSISNNYIKDARIAFEKAGSKSDLDKAKSHYLGKDSVLSKELKNLPNLIQEDKVNAGRNLNQARNQIEAMFREALNRIKTTSVYEPKDLSLLNNTNGHIYGHFHPTSLVLSQTYRIFTELGFAIVDSPEIESDWYNFEALNMPASHPARDMQDTFYIDNGKMNLLPRSHTSGMQVRFMEQNKPPYKIIVPGRVFRNEDEDATHAWIFNQVEGLVIGEGVSMSDLKGTLLTVVRGLLGHSVEIRFRASYFPYTEPSVELDCWYNGKWLELGGAGMVHPQVLINGGVNPDIYTGFAFGWGAERFAVIKYGLTDLRELWRPRFSFLEQF